MNAEIKIKELNTDIGTYGSNRQTAPKHIQCLTQREFWISRLKNIIYYLTYFNNLNVLC